MRLVTAALAVVMAPVPVLSIDGFIGARRRVPGWNMQCHPSVRLSCGHQLRFICLNVFSCQKPGRLNTLWHLIFEKGWAGGIARQPQASMILIMLQYPG
jgi:hypothetical protein